MTFRSFLPPILSTVLLIAPQAMAASVLKQINVVGPGSVEVQFDQPITKSQVEIEYVRDIVQVNLKDSSIYPAKVVPVSTSGAIKKVFAYQYTPSLVRFRLSVAGDARQYEGRVRVVPRGKDLRIEIGPPADRVVSAMAAPETKLMKELFETKPEAKPETKVEAKAEAKVEPAPAPKPSPVKASPTNRVLPSLKRVAMALAAALFAFVGIIWGIRRIRKTKLGENSWLGKLSKSPLLARSKWIEVVSSHHLGPKKSIAVVRVRGRNYLVGITPESINLISELSDEDAMSEAIPEAIPAVLKAQPGAGAVAAGKPQFAKTLERAIATDPSGDLSVRERIRRSMEGKKVLTQ